MSPGDLPVEAGDAWVRLANPPKGPRVYRKLIGETARKLRAGDRVAILDPQGELLGWGLYHPKSEIAVRLLRRGPEPADDDWLRARAAAAVRARLKSPEISGDVYRLLHAEGDDFPGLVVDRYGPVLSAEIYTAGAASLFDLALPVLQQELGTAEWRLSFDADSARAESEQPLDLHSPGCPQRLRIEENGVRYEIHFDASHKTGFFCDQRENRARLRAHCAGKRVLDVCCYTGGFALNAAFGGAAEVTGVDLDEDAIALAQRNLNLNLERLPDRSAPVRFVHADAFSYLRTLLQNDARYDVIVLDPPKFIHNRREWEEGIARYHDLNKLALRLVAPGGLLLTCSCSGLLQPIEFQETVRRASRGLGRSVRLLRTTGAGPDHPVRLDFPEGAYLKALWLRVD
ncbi:MAG: class I SAM-dependent rRNA methyltransferase [Planctomycetota bacterium]|nr:MAG: class I SAM-dependent rRNA methyltransferase [Planctomycetota bacterium]